MRKNILLEIIISLIIVLFLYTAASKLIDYKGFAAAMRNQVFPNRFVPTLVIILPAAEILTVVLLLFEKTRVFGLLASVLLMTVFTGYVASVMMHFFPRVPCSCGGVIKHLGWGLHLLLNLFYLMISVVGLFIQIQKQKQIKILLYNQAA
jgi:hypothetical protein